MKIAVLVPVFNTGPYLRKCMDSILAQSGVDIEVFCCDDGSTDDSLAILLEYEARDRRVHVMTQENIGVSEARNRLMDGLPDGFDVLAFVDSDDWIADGMYAKLAEAMVRTGADIAECEWENAECVIDDMSIYVMNQTAVGKWINVVNKLYRREVVGSIRFRKGLAFEEDRFFNCEAHAAAKRKVLVPGRFYFYSDNPTSATHQIDQRKYYASVTERIRLSIEELLDAGRVPRGLELSFRKELAADAFRICIRKNLKRNPNADLRKELFFAAGAFFREMETRHQFQPIGLNVIQKLTYRACLRGSYDLARFLVALT